MIDEFIDMNQEVHRDPIRLACRIKNVIRLCMGKGKSDKNHNRLFIEWFFLPIDTELKNKVLKAHANASAIVLRLIREFMEYHSPGPQMEMQFLEWYMRPDMRIRKDRATAIVGALLVVTRVMTLYYHSPVIPDRVRVYFAHWYTNKTFRELKEQALFDLADFTPKTDQPSDEATAGWNQMAKICGLPESQTGKVEQIMEKVDQ